MTSKAIPENTLVLITTGAEASLYRNRSKSGGIKLESVGSLTPKNLENEGPSGVRPPESSARETDEATFSKQLAEYLYQQAHAGEFSHLVLVADPDTLGEVRPILHQEVTEKCVLELGKTLINSSTEDIEKTIEGAI